MKSLNNILGLIGGYTALIWMVITFWLSGYEAHKFRSSLISSIFLCIPEEEELLNKTHEENSFENKEMNTDESKNLLKKRLGANNKVSFSYMQSLWTWIVLNLCCCFKNHESFKRQSRKQRLYNEACERLN